MELDRKLANKIADAFECPKDARRVVITLDFQANEFTLESQTWARIRADESEKIWDRLSQ